MKRTLETMSVLFVDGAKMAKDFEQRIRQVEDKIDQLQLTMDKMDAKLTKHIAFINKTYEGLKSPIKTVTGFFGKKYD